MAKPAMPSRITLLTAGFALAAVAVVGRAAQLQLGQGAQWRQRAAAQQTVRVLLPARRGTIYDRNGAPLAVSQETFGVGLSPRELDDESRALDLLVPALGLPRAQILQQLRTHKVWVEWPGPFTWTRVARLKSLRGVTLMRRLDRFYPRPELAARLIGRLDVRGRGASGLERAFDTLLAGRGGTAVMLRDPFGHLYPSPSRPVAEPIDGADVVLTLDAELQEIADRALRKAVADARATGGDVVILQPETGDILAMASVRPGNDYGSFVGDAFEPGSTAKPFAAAALLQNKLARASDTVFGERGAWMYEGRRITDVEKNGVMTLADVIKVSSNIGIAKFSQRLSHVQEFENLRDFGFGTPTGVELPGEAPGVLRPIRRWTALSAASLAMGYEFSVTPLQLAAAYGVFANDGVLMEPALVREVRGEGGQALWRHAPQPVRRVVEPGVASQVVHMLLGVVEEGTGRRAALGTYQVAGKTGTARQAVSGRYTSGHYWASFVGLFPAADPQLVLMVKIDDPQGDYFGGSTAAPVVRTILEAALASPAVSLDRGRLARRQGAQAPLAQVDSAPAPASATVPWPPPVPAPDTAQAAVPDVAGLDLRSAALALHHAGFRVRVSGWGTAAGTVPEAGRTARRGSLVTLRAGGAPEAPSAR